MVRPFDVVIEFLEAEQSRGLTHVLLDEAARDGLIDLHRRAQAHRKAVANKETVKKTEVLIESKDSLSPAVSLSFPTKVTALGKTNDERLASLREQAEAWPSAKALGTLREIMVFGIGNSEARLMFVGDAPGYEEEKKREPFIGPAGQKLDAILSAMGLSRAEVYISNLVKFRPAMARQTTNNRKPNPDEIAACLPFIRAEIEIIRPSCIVVLGQTAAEGLLGKFDNAIKLRGVWHEFEGVPIRVSEHPSYLLRNDANHQAKRIVWDDMLAVMEYLKMPISEKQRKFFQPKS